MSIRAIVFDIYDTLVYTCETGSRQRATEVAVAAGMQEEDWLRGWRATSIPAMCGQIPTMDERVRIALENAGYTNITDSLVNELAHLFLTRKTEHYYPDTCDTLEQLRHSGYRLAVLSNATPEEAHYIRNCGICSYFDEVVISCEVGLLKPKEAIYLLATQRLSVHPEECIFVGDGGSRELSGAQAAGMTAIYLQRNRREEGERDGCYDAMVRNLTELREWLARRQM